MKQFSITILAWLTPLGCSLQFEWSEKLNSVQVVGLVLAAITSLAVAVTLDEVFSKNKAK